MTEHYTTVTNDHERRLECIEANLDALVVKYLAKADAEYARFRDDSYDSDIAGAWLTEEILEARRWHELYMAIAQDVASILRGGPS